jgi:hypothetical protein
MPRGNLERRKQEAASQKSEKCERGVRDDGCVGASAASETMDQLMVILTHQ